MRQNRALRPDTAAFTYAWIYQGLFSLFNNPLLESFHHLPALLPALLAARAVLLGKKMERLAPPAWRACPAIVILPNQLLQPSLPHRWHSWEHLSCS